MGSTRFRALVRVAAPAIGVAMAVCAAMALTGCSKSFGFDMGPTTSIVLHDAWAKIAAEGDFDAGTAGMEDLRLEFKSSGDLDSIVLTAETDDGRRVSFGTLAPDHGRLRFMVSITEAGDNGGWSSSGPPIAPILAALDEGGLKSMITAMPGPRADVYQLCPIDAAQVEALQGNTSPSKPRVCLWKDGAFRSCTADEAWRAVGGGAACFVGLGGRSVTPHAGESTANAGVSTSTSVVQGIVGSQAYFVIPTVPASS